MSIMALCFSLLVWLILTTSCDSNCGFPLVTSTLLLVQIIVILHDPRASFLIANAINHNRLPFTSTTGVGKPEKDCDGRMDGDEKVMLHGLQERMMSSVSVRLHPFSASVSALAGLPTTDNHPDLA